MKFLKWIGAVTFSALAINAFATDVTGETIMDNYVGAGHSSDVKGYEYYYDTDKMVVSRDVDASGTTTTLNVDIFTSFYRFIGNNDIVLGDLFMATDAASSTPWSPFGNPWDPEGDEPYVDDRFSTTNNSNTGTNWNYAYDLGGDRDTTSGNGKLKSRDDSQKFASENLKDSTNGRDQQAVMVRNDGLQQHNDSSSWSVDNSSYYTKQHSYIYKNNEYFYNTDYGKVSFSFDVTGTALATANQIAFRWAMTCANDIIEGVASFAPTDNSTAVPEPQTVILMLLAMGGLIYRRKSTQL